jgi:hypothetical protein
MSRVWIVALILLIALPACCQSTAKYEPATVMKVTPHQSDSTDSSNEQYDVSLRVGNTLYTVLVTQPPGTISVQYREGRQLLVLASSKAIKFNDMLGRSFEVPILRKESAPAHKKP